MPSLLTTLLLSVIVSIGTTAAFFAPAQQAAEKFGASVFKPVQGGTGTSNIPTYGEVLVGDGSGAYTLMSTSSLGISDGSSNWATTSSDYWISQRSTTNLSEGTNLYFTTARATTSFIGNLAATTSVASISALPGLTTIKDTISGLVAAASGVLYGTPTTTVSCSGSVSCSSFTVLGSSPVTITASGGSGGGLASSTPWTPGYITYVKDNATLATVSTSSLSFSGPFSISASLGKLVGGSDASITYWGLSTTSQPSSGNLLVSNGAAGVYGTATSTLSAGSGLSGSFTQIGSGGSLSLNTANPNTWSALQTFSYSSSTAYSSFAVASSTNWQGGGLTTCTGANFLQWSGGFFSCAAAPAPASGGPGTISTSTVPTIGQLAFWTTSGSYPEKLASVATSSIAVGSTLSVSSGSFGYQIGGSNVTFGLNLGNANTWTALQTFNYASTTYASFDTSSSTNAIAGKLGVGSTTPLGRLSVKGVGTSNAWTFLTTDSANTRIFGVKDNGTSFFGDNGDFYSTAADGAFVESTATTTIGANVDGSGSEKLVLQNNGIDGLAIDILGRTTMTYASTTGLSTLYASSTAWRGGGLTTDCDTALTSKLLWDATTGRFSCGTDQSGGAGGSPGGSDTQVQYNSSGAFAGSSQFTFTPVPAVITLTGDDGPFKITGVADGAASNGLSISGGDATTPDTSGGGLTFNAGNASGDENGGTMNQFSGSADQNGNGGNWQINAGSGGAVSGDGGNFYFSAGAALGSGNNGTYYFANPATGIHGMFDFSALDVSDKTFSYPNLSGAFALGSYNTGFTSGFIPFGSSGLLATSSALSFDGTRLNTSYASTTAISTGTLCVGGSCTSTLPGSGSSFSYPFPGNATTTKLAFDGGLSAKDGVGHLAIDTTLHLLYNSSATATIDWVNLQLLDPSTGNSSVDWSNRTLTDASNSVALDWTARSLRDSTGNDAISWDDKRLLTTGSDALNWSDASDILLGGYDCSAYDNGGLLTVNATHELVCANNGAFTSFATFSAIDDPAAPSAGSLYLYAKNIAGRILPKFKGPSGIDTAVQTALFQNGIRMVIPENSTTIRTWGMPTTNVGTVSTPALASTNLLTQTTRFRLTSASTANSASERRSAQTIVWRGNADGLGGWFYNVRFAFTTATANQRSFIGFAPGTGALSTSLEPISQTNIIGIGNGLGSTTLAIMHNDNSGQATWDDLGSNFPSDTTSAFYDFTMFAAPNDSQITWRVIRLDTGDVAEGTITTNLPVNTTFLAPHEYMNNGGTAAAVQIDISRVYIETDY